ncbi:hypothetical protein N8J89_00195 [Crossiella sp. CA-258035]|uniref:hypothetical protein n=1 Tax=Crossiella sp. CA-258035 TaxID=2981138 RepID=UPI0024BD3F8B|nr:hypothetical protein [Crossiella sp. CA-258035]WHT19556.1 hypothetical protein N8J89_00195 [Crossiella sp. CA-258035]
MTSSRLSSAQAKSGCRRGEMANPRSTSASPPGGRWSGRSTDSAVRRVNGSAQASSSTASAR